MSTPTATPRTDDEETPLITNHRVSAETYKRMVDLARELETELACEKENRNHLIEKGAKLETELAAAKSECERLKAMGSWLHTCIHHTDDQRTRAERCPVCATIERDRLRAENSTLRAAQKACEACDEPTAFEVRQLRDEVERLKGALALGQENCDDIYNDMRKERTELTARAERAEAMLAEWSVLNLWGGTPEIIHEFIKGQQNRIHHCQDLEAALAEAVDGEINGGSIFDKLLVVHIPRLPVGYRVGQPVKVILPAIDAAMKP